MTEIQWNAIQNCTALNKLTIKDGTNLKNIGRQAFLGCSSLETFDIPSTVTSMGSYIFGNCTSLKSVTWPSGVTKMPEKTFQGCTSLATFTIPDGVTSIGKECFQSTGLTSITLPSSLETLGKAAFKECSYLVTVNGLENTKVTWLGETFLRCSALTTVKLPKNLETFESGGDGTFNGCSCLQSVGEFPTTLTFIGKQTFANSGLSGEIDLSKCVNLTTFQGSTFACTKITKIVLPSSITELGDHTFNRCTELEEIVGLEFINVAALQGNLIEGTTKVTELRLPMNPSDGMLEVGNLFWDRTSHITVYVANNKVALDNIFGHTSCKITFVYCGNDYETFLASTGNTAVATNVGENVYAAGAEIDTTKHSFIYGYNLCDAFYNGEHEWKNETNVIANNYFEKIEIGTLVRHAVCRQLNRLLTRYLPTRAIPNAHLMEPIL